eukprot:Em0009g172a
MESESGDQYITELYDLAERCSYGSLTSKMIRDRLVVGIRDKALSERLQLHPDLTLEKTKTMLRQKEAVHSQQQVLQEAYSSPLSVEPGMVNVLRSQETWTKPSSGTFTKPKQTPRQCTKCGKGQHPGTSALLRIQFATNASGKDTSAHSAYQRLWLSSETWRVKLRLCGQMLEFKLDTGAEVSAISDAAFKTLRGSKLKSPKKTLYGPARTPLKVIGQLEWELSHQGKTTNQPVYVVKDLKTNLLGLPAILALDLVARVEETVETLPHIVERYPTLFQGLGSLGEPYGIQLKPDAQPYALFTSRNIPLPLRSKVEQELKQMESLGIISKVDKPTPWCAGMVVVHKKNGAIRICVDYQPLNRAPEHFQKRMSQILAGLKGVLCQMNDVLVFGSDNDIRLTAALDRIWNGGVTLNREKCEFEKNKLLFLGRVVDHQGIQADPEKTSAIQRLKSPNNTTEL